MCFASNDSKDATQDIPNAKAEKPGHASIASGSEGLLKPLVRQLSQSCGHLLCRDPKLPLRFMYNRKIGDLTQRYVARYLSRLLYIVNKKTKRLLAWTAIPVEGFRKVLVVCSGHVTICLE